jgi:hypothetical protein
VVLSDDKHIPDEVDVSDQREDRIISDFYCVVEASTDPHLKERGAITALKHKAHKQRERQTLTVDQVEALKNWWLDVVQSVVTFDQFAEIIEKMNGKGRS